MSKSAPTQGERLAVIEKILEDAFGETGTMCEVRNDVKAIRRDFEAHKQDYQALKNRGIGAAAVLSVMFAGLGFLVNALWDKITGLFA